MKIYTKTGDAGTTALYGGARVSKSDERVETYGTIDELNAHLGLLRDQEVNKDRTALFQEIQETLFVIGSHLAADPSKPSMKLPPLPKSMVLHLEESIDAMDTNLPAMKFFILPGGHPAVSVCHVARCVCRRAERQLVRFGQHEAVNPVIIVYLNRLSDWLFVLARTMGQELGVDEIPWKPEKS